VGSVLVDRLIVDIPFVVEMAVLVLTGLDCDVFR
jgi:hypothetical protein